MIQVKQTRKLELECRKIGSVFCVGYWIVTPDKNNNYNIKFWQPIKDFRLRTTANVYMRRIVKARAK